MYALATLIGFPTINAVVDDFLRRLRQHAVFSAILPEGDLKPLRLRLVHFWSAVLNGESWNLPLASNRSNPGRLPSLLGEGHGVVLGVFREAIDSLVSGDLAQAWHRRVDILQQSFTPVDQCVLAKAGTPSLRRAW
ncbi:truncated hemoglobin [Amantichitinum ursilacus]|uniref:Uncharacterized protein n=1 Tax=Amantichitinum ursilacus TaxID=857265 RepID=A0A0N0GN60_9NEIS|nr:hypothetical protein [Amantichitinum ursilacus]KPC52150.1 hypothetical protein WG78_13860 [Amantichitinum ursilacus]